MSYKINIYRFKYQGIILQVLARSKQTALKIVEIENTNSYIRWKPKIIGFKQKTVIDVDPQIIESEQLQTAKKHLAYRNKRKEKL